MNIQQLCNTRLPHNRIYIILFRFFLPFYLLFPLSICAQDKRDESKVNLQVERTLKPSQQLNIISTIVKIKNTSDNDFLGNIHIKESQGMRSISGNMIPVNIPMADSLFIPVKLIIQSNIEAGTFPILFNLSDNNGEIIQSSESFFTIEEKTNLFLNTPQNNIFITNPNDSVRIKTTVINTGNNTQDITLVFSIPTLKEGINFIEQKTSIKPMQEHTFTFSIFPSSDLLEQQQFTINISAMNGKNKDLFGNSIITVQNVSANRRYSNPNITSDIFSSYQNNAIKVNYRRSKASEVIQLSGSGSIDLTAGYIGLTGNIYQTSSDKSLVGTNTSLMYKLENNEIILGNVYELLEATLSGRGVKISLGNHRDKTLQVGFIDRNYNLFSSTPFFENGYGMYAIGKISNSNKLKNISSSIIYQSDPIEQLKNTIVGGEANFSIKNYWNFNLKIHGAMSHIELTNKNKFSGSSELQYNLNQKGYEYSGAYYFSSNYFPGDRKGMFSLQQTLYKKFYKDYSFRTSVFYSDFAPRSYNFQMNSKSNSFNGDIELYIPKIKSVTTSISYQNQYESSNSFLTNSSSSNNFQDTRMIANRLKETIRWSIPNHSIFVSQENGFAKYPMTDKQNLQLKTNITYSHNWLNVMSSYQYGSYYLSEYLLSLRETKKFRRFIMSAAVNKRLIDGKWTVSAGGSLIDDLSSSYSPSTFLNIKYLPSKLISINMNSTWNSYKFKNMPMQNIYNIEVGVTINLHKSRSSSKKKSKISTLVFYDKNTNGIFDEDEIPAKNYNVKINDIPFISGDNGKFTYSYVPFGNYNIGQISENGWFFPGDTIHASKFKTDVFIPLQQAGTLIGKINYIYNTRSSIDFTPKNGGIIFQITSSDNKTIQKVMTDNNGNFTAFLPTGDYKVELIESSLARGSFCKNPSKSVTVTTGKIINLKAFDIEVQQKRVNVKYFSQ